MWPGAPRMYDLGVEKEISAGHQLRGYRGECEKFHGHNWLVRLEVSVPDLDALGLGVDFSVVKSALERALAEYDHALLNDLPDFAQDNPTSENLARRIFGKCRDLLSGLERPVRVKCVTVWESSTAYARYHE